MPPFIKNTASKFKFGAHVSAAGGISNSVLNAHKIGAGAFSMFLKSPRKWDSPPIPAEEVTKFKQNCTELGYDPAKDVLPHGHYFINMANPDRTKADKAFGQLLDELHRCEQLGIGRYNLHPGSALKGGDHAAQVKQLAKYLNDAIAETHDVRIVLENMAGKDNLIGNDLRDLKSLIDLVDEKDRVGVCVDTCHAFAAGYDISTKDTFDKFWQEFDEIVGLQYLCAMHLNDSKAPLGANQDLHERLGQGYLALEPFRLIAHADYLQDIPLILETPYDNDEGYGHEIEMLHWLETVDDPEDVKLSQRNEELQSLGEKSRKEHLAKLAKKQTKAATTSKRKRDGSDIMDQMSRGKKPRPRPVKGE
ncbi:DNA-(apurinic or apyrimidinic site) lyase APN1 KNAG_0A06400 [Huiozyma naganishii CBS 8797]|uniref:Apurinic-apyrimidinic endonuclease 1 n=1 Tax=Huiozyma naganishii (strain ATCC MYA-139 / BCRC 22969 / CBS 8797 / KCTC 17520 / NBRC 10181 / NCYC 3082 / Yp74L-3) TaxID=1071383 RepID=J7S2Q0_HUIN7|nr:hypothetical protein KNAG_0A06400 [Kazachstania naganishii CBS 8797]CCK68299.1 hypothetical protein KNAG_0A06400 [Kazachstania naganishii CBS 8797]